MVKKIIYSQRAFADIDRIIEFNNLRNRSTTYSEKFVTQLHKRLQQLLKQPLSGMNTDELNRLVLIWSDYYVFYKIEGDLIRVLAIYHQKENISR